MRKRPGIKETLFAAGAAAVLGCSAGDSKEKEPFKEPEAQKEIYNPDEHEPKQSVLPEVKIKQAPEVKEPMEAKKMPPYFISNNKALEKEVFSSLKGLENKEVNLVKSEWERVAKQEEESMYKKRFNNSDKMVEKYFARITEDEEYRKKLRDLLAKHIGKYNVPMEIALGMVGVESGGDNNAVSKSKPSAKGILQLVPSTAREMGLRVDGQVDEREDPGKNIEAGLKYLSGLKTRFGSWGLALIAYSEGGAKFKDQICRNYPEIESKNTKYKKKSGKSYKSFTNRGYKDFLQMVRKGEITTVQLYSKEFKGLGKIHPYQYPFYVNAMGKQMLSIMNGEGVLPVSGKKVAVKDKKILNTNI